MKQKRPEKSEHFENDITHERFKPTPKLKQRSRELAQAPIISKMTLGPKIVGQPD
ncbi:MAG: hypothetical protein Q8Q23_05165 [bacterium]|nr:hypothetical protein [bacterium]